MDVADSAGSLLSIDFTNSVAISDFRTIAVSRNGITTGWNLASDLSRKDIADRAILVHNAKGLAVNLDNTGNSCSAVNKLAIV